LPVIIDVSSSATNLHPGILPAKCLNMLQS